MQSERVHCRRRPSRGQRFSGLRRSYRRKSSHPKRNSTATLCSPSNHLNKSSRRGARAREKGEAIRILAIDLTEAGLEVGAGATVLGTGTGLGTIDTTRIKARTRDIRETTGTAATTTIGAAITKRGDKIDTTAHTGGMAGIGMKVVDQETIEIGKTQDHMGESSRGTVKAESIEMGLRSSPTMSNNVYHIITRIAKL